MKQYFLVIGLCAGALYAGRLEQLKPDEVRAIYNRGWHECTTMEKIVEDSWMDNAQKTQKVKSIAEGLLKDTKYLKDNWERNGDTTILGKYIGYLELTINSYLTWAKDPSASSAPKPVILAEDSDPDDDDADCEDKDDDDPS